MRWCFGHKQTKFQVSVGPPSSPVHDVVDLDETVGGATRHTAAAVAALDDAAGAVGHDLLGTPDRERQAIAFPHRLDVAVASSSSRERRQGSASRR